MLLAPLEVVERLLVVALDPTSLVETDRLPLTLRAILMQQAILNHLKLQLTHRTDDLPSVELIDKELSHTLVHQLLDTLVQLFRLHRVGILDVFEHLG